MSRGLQAIRRSFALHADRPCLIAADGAALSYAEVQARASDAAHRLAEAGLSPGDVVAVTAGNSVDQAVALLGAWTAGLTVAPLNVDLGAHQLASIVGNAGAVVVLHDEDHAALAGQLGRAQSIASILDSGADCRRPVTPIFDRTPPDAPATIIYTAGSTGLPKGVQIGAEALLANEVLFCEAMGITPEHRFFGLLPMSYLGGLHNLLLLPMTAGASIVIDKPLGPTNLFYFWRRVRERGIDTLWLTGAMLSLLLQIPPRGDESWIGGQIRLGLVGMAPLQADVRRRFEERFGFPLHQNYALSETLFLTSQRPGEPADPSGCGRLLEGVGIDLRRADGEHVGTDEDGELYVRTPHMMLGYRHAAPSDRAALQDGVFRTGDLGRFDERGELRITGRVKDLIIRGGLNIAPALVEAALVVSPLVAEAAVVGVPHPIYGEEVAAVVALSTEGRALAEDEVCKAVLAHAARELPVFQQPKSLTVMDVLPRNHAGKIDKPAIRRLLAAEG